jgi:UDP-3-O-[3-hydroxymyristoyl] N-acetylglucosamine deacetylase
MNLQRTIQHPVTVEGIGLHSGKPARLRILPARPNQGICFVRTDLPESPAIPAHFSKIVNTQLATTLGEGRVTISTVEHLMCALALRGIDNATCEVSGPEVPIMDGSSRPFVLAIDEVGVQTQAVARPVLSLRRRVELQVGEKWAVAEPSSRLEIHSTIEWDHPAIGHQEFHFRADRTSAEELWAARTFGFLKDVEALQRMGLARGGSLENAVVLDEARVLNPEGLRYTDEFVRHKTLDALGDLKLAGIEIQAYFRLHRSGHDLHSQLLAAIFRDPANYEILEGAAEASREEPGYRIRQAAMAAAT